MPELPEVETVRAGLEPVLRGRRFMRVEQRRKDLRFPLPERFRRAADRPQGFQARAPREIHPGASRQGRGAGGASRHDGAVQRAAAARASQQTPSEFPSPWRGGVRGGGNPNSKRSAIPPSPALPHKGRAGAQHSAAGEFSSANTPTTTATTPSTTISCSRCPAAPSSPTTTPAASGT